VNERYLIGVALAILSGFVIQGGLVAQKKVVNEIPREAREKRFMRTLLRHPVWVTGFLVEFFGGAATFMAAQVFIGPALVPGLMASGYIILVIGSLKILGESINRSEYLGILLLIIGITLMGLSELGIEVDTVQASLSDADTLLRITIFTVTLTLLWIILHLASLKSARRKGIIMAFSNGFPFALTNFWISPLIAVIHILKPGVERTEGQIILFVIASLILVGTNVFGIRQTQEAFKFAQASNVIPVQQMPIQVAPVLYYFSVFSLDPPSRMSAVYMITGVLLIIVSGFILGRRQAELERIE